MTRWAPIEAGAYLTGEPLRIGAGTHLLGHGGLVEDRRGLVRRVTPPERAGQVLEPELPWEHVKTFGPTVLADERSGTLRMWYGTLPPLGGRPGKLVIPPYLMLYAESDDGLRWRKPLLDLVSDGEHRRTNILYRGAHDNCSAFSVVIDRADPDPSRRYKMLHKGGKDPSGRSGEELAFSADGLRWRPYEGNPGDAAAARLQPQPAVRHRQRHVDRLPATVRLRFPESGRARRAGGTSITAAAWRSRRAAT